MEGLIPRKAAAQEVHADPVQAESRAWYQITDSSLPPFVKDGMLDAFAFCRCFLPGPQDHLLRALCLVSNLLSVHGT